MYVLSVIQVTIYRYSKSTETDKLLSEYMDNDLSLLPTYIISSLSLLFNIEITNYHYFYQLVLNLVTTAFIIDFTMNEKVVIMANRTIDEENVKIGRLLQDARESHGILQSELCEATGLTKNHISAVERGVSKASIRMLLGYCEKIGITPNDILGYSELNLIPELQEMLNHMDIEQQKRIVDMIKLMSK